MKANTPGLLLHRCKALRRPVLCWRLLLSLLFVWLISDPPSAVGKHKMGKIVAPALNLRSGPGLHHPPIATLPQGSQVLVLSYEGEWVRILFEDQTGFIINREDYLHIDLPGVDPVNDSAMTDAGQADELERELVTSRQKVAAFSNAEATLVNSLEATEKALDRSRKKVARLAAELKTLAQQISEIEDRYRLIEERTATTEQYVNDRLDALYRLSWLGKINVLASADTMFDFFSHKRAMEHILLQDEADMAQLARDKHEMQALLNQLVVRKNEKQATTADLNARIQAMNAAQSTREALLAEIRGKKSLQLAAIAATQKSARELDRTVASFDTSSTQATLPTPAEAEKPFEALKGLLMMPVKGNIISFFGQYKDRILKVNHFQSGIDIKADRGEPIRAVYSGRTLFSSWFKGFGNMIIIDHGDHYYTVYAHLEEQFKSKGDPVETGEVIATVGDTGSLTGTGLHFEIRHHGKPLNPLGWIKKG